ncbi:MAG: hypothetical protein HOP33_12375 [Verrucomicrobia bacterium]|nr:hypothetical protein [Verrucomicrobiota bacterium]
MNSNTTLGSFLILWRAYLRILVFAAALWLPPIPLSAATDWCDCLKLANESAKKAAVNGKREAKENRQALLENFNTFVVAPLTDPASIGELKSELLEGMLDQIEVGGDADHESAGGKMEKSTPVSSSAVLRQIVVSDPKTFIKSVGRASDFLQEYQKHKGEGVIDGLYLTSKKYAMNEAKAKIKELNEKLLGAGLVEGPVTAMLESAGFGALSTAAIVVGAGYVATKVVEGLVDGFWKRIEDVLCELMCDPNEGNLSELDSILKAAQADLDSALKLKMDELQSQRNQLANAGSIAKQVGRSLDNMPSATAGAFVKSSLEMAQHTFSVLNKQQNSASGLPGQISAANPNCDCANKSQYLYEIQIAGTGADGASGKTGFKVQIWPCATACGAIKTALATTDESFQRYIGILDVFATNSAKAMNLKASDLNREIPESSLRMPLRTYP